MGKGVTQSKSLERRSVQYLSVISDPPDVGDRSHLAGPQNSSQVHFLIPHRHKGSWEMDILQLTYSGTHIHHRVNSMHCAVMCKKKKKQQLYCLKWGEKGGGEWVYRWVGGVSLLRILSCAGTVGCHVCVIFHPWHSWACGGSICSAGT